MNICIQVLCGLMFSFPLDYTPDILGVRTRKITKLPSCSSMDVLGSNHSKPPRCTNTPFFWLSNAAITQNARFDSQSNLCGLQSKQLYFYSHFIDEKTESPRGKVTSSRSHNQLGLCQDSKPPITTSTPGPLQCTLSPTPTSYVATVLLIPRKSKDPFRT